MLWAEPGLTGRRGVPGGCSQQGDISQIWHVGAPSEIGQCRQQVHQLSALFLHPGKSAWLTTHNL